MRMCAEEGGSDDTSCQLTKVEQRANTTSSLGWQYSGDDATNGRDRDGTWVTRNETLMKEMKGCLNQTLPRMQSWQWLLTSPWPFVVPSLQSEGAEVRILFLPAGSSLPAMERPTGAVILSKALFGACDVKQMLGNPRGKTPMREAVRSKIDTSGVSLYLGGPCRIYGESSLEKPCAILEVTLMPKLRITNMNGFVEDETDDGYRNVTELTLDRRGLAELLTAEGCDGFEDAWINDRGEETGEDSGSAEEVQDLDVDLLRKNVGGLDDQIGAIVRRAFATRRLPAGTMQELGVSHVKGLLLHGPPGCGKTLIAREIGKALRARPPKVVNGPEILDKWVGEAERNVRALFWDAEREWKEKGDKSALHIIILDELDSVARRRGSLRGDSSGVRDSVVNQLLAKLDGVDVMNNLLVIGLTNRKDLIDPALLRPGRLEVHIEVKPPDAAGRLEILHIHLRRLQSTGRLANDVWEAASDVAGEATEGWTGAELAGVVRSAVSFALERAVQQVEEAGGVQGGLDKRMEHVMVRTDDL